MHTYVDGKICYYGNGSQTQLLNVAKRITSTCKSLTHNDFQIQKEYVCKQFLVFITKMYLGVYLALELISKSLWTYIVFIYLSFNITLQIHLYGKIFINSIPNILKRY